MLNNVVLLKLGYRNLPNFIPSVNKSIGIDLVSFTANIHSIM